MASEENFILCSALKSLEDKGMLVGLISDTHDNLPMVEKAVKRLNEEKVGLVLHAGDYVAPFVICCGSA